MVAIGAISWRSGFYFSLFLVTFQLLFFCFIFGRVFRLILGALGVHFGSHFQ